MEHIKQLKSIRDGALSRLSNNTDYKLLTSLDELIVELEGVTAIAELAEKSVVREIPDKSDLPETGTKPVKTLDQAFDALSKTKTANGSGGSIVNLSEEINGGVSLS